MSRCRRKLNASRWRTGRESKSRRIASHCLDLFISGDSELENVVKIFRWVVGLIFCASIIASADEPTYLRKMDEFRNKVKIDTVAQVLNYSDGFSDDLGDNYGFWYAYDAKNCIYRKAEYVRVSPSDDYKKIVFDVNENARELNLNAINKNSIKYDDLTLNYPARGVDGLKITHKITVYGGGRILFSTDKLDAERIKRGWSLIYSKYCSGDKKEF